ncbi:MAG: DEAD/DEAH box helicase [Deltaproteobacteria bacterium]|nr:MAG: DEAD/DEAH box helicase [Deltaproteobacteria bacterium]
MLAITIKNNLRLAGIPPVLRKTLIEKLKFPNPKWIENHRMGRWNRGVPRELRFYDQISGGGLWIPRGYLRQLIFLCRRFQVNYRINDQRRNLPAVDLAFSGQLKSFQQEAVSRMLTKEFGTLSSPTGSGKTIMALYILARRRQPALVVVHTKDLVHQWIDRITDFLKIPANQIGVIGGGKKFVGEKITVALVQSLYKCAAEVSPHIGNLIVDECHRTPSRTFTEAVTEFDSRYMLGLSATPWRRDKLSKLIFWHLGDVHHQIDKGHLIETGYVLPADVMFRQTNFRPFYDPVMEYSKMLSELTADDERNRLIASDIARESQDNPGVCLVLSDRKKHCETLQTILKYRHRVSAEIMTGDLSSNQRREVLERLSQGRVKVLIATGQLIGEGFDCRELSTLFLATPVRFSGRVLQYLGRVLRPAPGKREARVFDYVDVQVDPLVAAANARRKIYRS